MKLKSLFTVCLLLVIQTLTAGSRMPVIAYYGPVIDRMSLEQYRDLKSCGFTHTINIYNNTDKALDDLTLAGKAGMKVFVHVPGLLNDAETTVKKLRTSGALSGYFLADEPSMSDLPKYVHLVRTIRQFDSLHKCCINLHPYYDNRQLRAIGASSYKNYLQAASGIGLPQISFDFYPVTETGLRTQTWFYTLNAIRQESLRTKKPFWAYILSVPHNDYPQPTLAMLRLPAYVNLAYGAQALAYFTYKTPVDARYSFHNAPIEKDGRKTQTYTLVKQMNSELKHVSSLFYGAKILSLGHLIKVPSGCSKASAPRGVRKMFVKGRAGALVSVFVQQGHRYMAIVNKDYTDVMSLSISFSSSKAKYITKGLQNVAPRSSYTILPGDIAIFMLE